MANYKKVLHRYENTSLYEIIAKIKDIFELEINYSQQEERKLSSVHKILKSNDYSNLGKRLMELDNEKSQKEKGTL